MAIRAARVLQPEWYTPEDQKDDPQPTRFKIRPLNQLELMEITDVSQITADGDIVLTAAARKRLVELGVTDWENFPDAETGEPIECSAAGKRRIPIGYLNDLSFQIFERTALTLEEKKL